MIEPSLVEASQRFWAAAGELEPFPRALEEPVLWALPLAILKLPRLWVTDVESWLRQRGLTLSVGTPNRPLRGCLIAYGGKGCVLLDGTDPIEDRRFSLAHEVAHFMLDYLVPRQQATSRFGERVLEVLDGMRPPTIQERVDALLTETSIGTHTHLMERRADGLLVSPHIVSAESRADRLALELLAPMEELLRRVAHVRQPAGFRMLVDLAVQVLVNDFGLPLAVAEPYGNFAVRCWTGGPTFREWLGIL